MWRASAEIEHVFEHGQRFDMRVERVALSALSEHRLPSEGGLATRHGLPKLKAIGWITSDGIQLAVENVQTVNGPVFWVTEARGTSRMPGLCARAGADPDQWTIAAGVSSAGGNSEYLARKAAQVDKWAAIGVRAGRYFREVSALFGIQESRCPQAEAECIEGRCRLFGAWQDSQRSPAEFQREIAGLALVHEPAGLHRARMQPLPTGFA